MSVRGLDPAPGLFIIGQVSCRNDLWYNTEITYHGEFTQKYTVDARTDLDNYSDKLRVAMSRLQMCPPRDTPQKNIFQYKELETCSHVFLRRITPQHQAHRVNLPRQLTPYIAPHSRTPAFSRLTGAKAVCERIHVYPYTDGVKPLIQPACLTSTAGPTASIAIIIICKFEYDNNFIT